MSLKNDAAKLKKLGFINYDLRKRLHWKQKEKITKLAKNYEELLKRPQDFIHRTIGNESAIKLRQSGYKTHKDVRTGKTKSIVPLARDALSARISKGRITVRYEGFTEKWILGTKQHEFAKELQRLKKTQANNPNFQITGKIGDNQPFRHSRFLTVEEMERYLVSWKINYPSSVKGKRARADYKNDLLQHLAIVEIDQHFRQGKTSVKKIKKNRRH